MISLISFIAMVRLISTFKLITAKGSTSITASLFFGDVHRNTDCDAQDMLLHRGFLVLFNCGQIAKPSEG